MNPWHCSGRFSNPDPFRREAAAATERPCIANQMGSCPLKEEGSPAGTFSHLVALPQVLSAAQVMAIASRHGSLTSELCWLIWTVCRPIVGLFLNDHSVVLKTVLHNGNEESCGKDKAGSAIKLKRVPKATRAIICALHVLTKVTAGCASGQTLLGKPSPSAHVGVSGAVSVRWLNACGLGPVAHQPWKDVPPHIHVCRETHA